MYDFKEIESEKYISLETYRKNNQPVKTPVLFVIKDNLIYVVTGDKTGKVKRLRNNLQVKFALCTIRGKVTSVIDGDTFKMTVSHTGKNNKFKYKDNETIRIEGIDKPEIDTDAGKKAKTILSNKISGKEVRVYMKSRDPFGRVLGKYEIIT